MLSSARCSAAVSAARASGVPIPASTSVQPSFPASAYILTVRSGKGIGNVNFQIPGTTSRASGSGSSGRVGVPLGSAGPNGGSCIQRLSFRRGRIIAPQWDGSSSLRFAQDHRALSRHHHSVLKLGGPPAIDLDKRRLLHQDRLNGYHQPLGYHRTCPGQAYTWHVRFLVHPVPQPVSYKLAHHIEAPHLGKRLDGIAYIADVLPRHSRSDAGHHRLARRIQKILVLRADLADGHRNRRVAAVSIENH